MTVDTHQQKQDQLCKHKDAHIAYWKQHNKPTDPKRFEDGFIQGWCDAEDPNSPNIDCNTKIGQRKQEHIKSCGDSPCEWAYGDGYKEGFEERRRLKVEDTHEQKMAELCKHKDGHIAYWQARNTQTDPKRFEDGFIQGWCDAESFPNDAYTTKCGQRKQEHIQRCGDSPCEWAFEHGYKEGFESRRCLHVNPPNKCSQHPTGGCNCTPTVAPPKCQNHPNGPCDCKPTEPPEVKPPKCDTHPNGPCDCKPAPPKEPPVSQPPKCDKHPNGPCDCNSTPSKEPPVANPPKCDKHPNSTCDCKPPAVTAPVVSCSNHPNGPCDCNPKVPPPANPPVTTSPPKCQQHPDTPCNCPPTVTQPSQPTKCQQHPDTPCDCASTKPVTTQPPAQPPTTQAPTICQQHPNGGCNCTPAVPPAASKPSTCAQHPNNPNCGCKAPSTSAATDTVKCQQHPNTTCNCKASATTSH